MKSSRWTFTLNNPVITSDELEVKFRAGKSYKFLVFQKEVGEANTPHYQGFVIFDGQRRLSAVRKLLDRAHWEPAQGSSVQNEHYCTKPVLECHCTHCNGCPPPLEGPWSFGVCPETTGARTDLKRLRDEFKSGKRKRDIINDDSLIDTYGKYMRFGDRVQSLMKPQARSPPEVTLLYGPAGCGKTREVYDNEEDLWMRPVDDAMWFDGYDNHDAALFDDFAGKFSKTSLSNLLRLLDRYPIFVPIKGSHTWFVPKRIFITTNIHPSDWYEWVGREAQFPALSRRVTRVVCWGADGTQRREYNKDDEGWQRFWTTSIRGATIRNLHPDPFDQFF